VLAEFTEVESGKRNDRPELLQAIHHAKITSAVLVVAKMDRLSRDAAFLLTLRNSGTKFIAADQPDVNELTVGILALIAQDERQRISARTSAALQAAKARGQRLGNPNGAAAFKRAGKGTVAAVAAVKAAADKHAQDLAGTIIKYRDQGHTSLRQLAAALNEGGITAPRGGKWHPTSVKNLLARLGMGE
jgi:DNA invertase Pin-like site-specific DNA recombinase